MPAEIIDINSADTPQGNFLLDTNVLLWYTYQDLYPAGEDPKHWQSESYPNFVKRLLEKNQKIYYCAYSLSELYHVIERIYTKLINERFTDDSDPGYIKHSKDLRRNYPEDKNRLDNNFKSMCIDINSIASSIPLFNNIICDKLHKYINKYKVDVNDALIYYSMEKCGITNIISDDSDFSNVDSIRLYTANRHVINK